MCRLIPCPRVPQIHKVRAPDPNELSGVRNPPVANIGAARSAVHHRLPHAVAIAKVGAATGRTIDMTTLEPAQRPLNHATARAVVRWLLAALYLTAGIFHLTRPQPFLGITPNWVPWPDTAILLTGLAELAAVPALLQPWSQPLRRAAGIGLAVYAVCVYPANVNHMIIDLAKPDHGLGLAYHIPRQLAQPLVVWAALWASGAIDWPWRHKL